MKRWVILLLISVILVSCQKNLFLERKYVTGNYNEKLNSQNKKTPRHSIKLPRGKVNVKESATLGISCKQSGNPDNKIKKPNNKRAKVGQKNLKRDVRCVYPKQDIACGDSILLTNNKVIVVKILQEDTDKLKFRFCADETNSVYDLNRSEIVWIKYLNDSTSVTQNNVTTLPKENKEKKFTFIKFFGFMLTTIFGVLITIAFLMHTGFWPFAILSGAVLFFVFRSVIKICNGTSKHHGLGFKILGIFFICSCPYCWPL